MVAEAAAPPGFQPQPGSPPAGSTGDTFAGSSRVAALLAPGQTLRIFPNDFDDSSKVRRVGMAACEGSSRLHSVRWLVGRRAALSCTARAVQVCSDLEVLRAAFPSFSLPSAGPRTSLLFLLSSVDCAGGKRGILAGFGGGGSGAGPQVDAAIDCGTQRLVLSSAGSGSASFQLPPGAAAAANATRPLALLLTQDAEHGGFNVCINGAQLSPLGSGGAMLLAQLGSDGGGSLLGSAALVLGSRSDASRSVRADVAAVFALDSLVACNRTRAGQSLAALQQDLEAASQASPQPLASVDVQQQPGGNGVVEEPVQLRVSASPAAAGTPLR
jgi:hypothetical protein